MVTSEGQSQRKVYLTMQLVGWLETRVTFYTALQLLALVKLRNHMLVVNHVSCVLLTSGILYLRFFLHVPKRVVTNADGTSHLCMVRPDVCEFSTVYTCSTTMLQSSGTCRYFMGFLKGITHEQS